MGAERVAGKAMVYICNDCGFLSESIEAATAHFTESKTRSHRLRLYTYEEATATPITNSHGKRI
jgi:hypothetical protein